MTVDRSAYLSKTGERTAKREERLRSATAARDAAYRSGLGDTSGHDEDVAQATEALAAEQAAVVAPVLHRITESFTDDRTQTVRCMCGKSAQFSRERGGYLGTVRENARALTEFVCTGGEIMLRNALIKEVR